MLEGVILLMILSLVFEFLREIFVRTVGGKDAGVSIQSICRSHW